MHRLAACRSLVFDPTLGPESSERVRVEKLILDRHAEDALVRGHQGVRSLELLVIYDSHGAVFVAVLVFLGLDDAVDAV